MFPSQIRHRELGFVVRRLVMVDEAPFVRFLPDGKPGAGGPPGRNDLGIRSRRRPDPFEEVENQCFDGIGHDVVSYAPNCRR